MISLSKDSWMRVELDAVPCTKEQFDAMWGTCPVTKEKITMFKKISDVPRYQKLFGEASYSFSGMTLVPDPVIPDLVQRCLDYARVMHPGCTFNGALTNYYPDGESYISFHSDSESDLDPSAPILSFSFGAERTFVVKAKDGVTDVIVREIKIPTKNGSLIAMGGKIQRQFLHGVPKATKADGDVGPRLNITIRSLRPKSVKKQRVAEE
jgi:alkylated DNA repair dioxygenase AlkB